MACILEAAETRSIIAATDIFDINGLKLWARERPVSAELQRRLADRELRDPLETSLVAQDGVTTAMVQRDFQALVESPCPLAPLLRQHGTRLCSEVGTLVIQSAPQLLLTAAQSARPHSYAHALRAMGLCGALALAGGRSAGEVRSAMLAGLLHDLGEIYLDPRHNERDVDREVDFLSYQQLVVHPHIGHLILKQLTSYPASVATAVAEHHERLDGSGYPRALQAAQLSPLGRLLAVAEAALHAMEDPYAGLMHASVALRAVPGEFDAAWIGHISRWANLCEAAQPVMEMPDIRARLHALDGVLSAAQAAAGDLARLGGSAGLRGAIELAEFLLIRLRTGWNESGLWAGVVGDAAQAAEVEAIEDELYRRLRRVRCATLMRAGDLEARERTRLREFCDSLAMGRG